MKKLLVLVLLISTQVIASDANDEKLGKVAELLSISYICDHKLKATYLQTSKFIAHVELDKMGYASEQLRDLLIEAAISSAKEQDKSSFIKLDNASAKLTCNYLTESTYAAIQLLK